MQNQSIKNITFYLYFAVVSAVVTVYIKCD